MSSSSSPPRPDPSSPLDPSSGAPPRPRRGGPPARRGPAPGRHTPPGSGRRRAAPSAPPRMRAPTPSGRRSSRSGRRPGSASPRTGGACCGTPRARRRRNRGPGTTLMLSWMTATTEAMRRRESSRRESSGRGGGECGKGGRCWRVVKMNDGRARWHCHTMKSVMRLGAQGWAKFKILADYSQNFPRNLALFILFLQEKKANFADFFLDGTTVWRAQVEKKSMGFALKYRGAKYFIVSSNR